MDAGAVALLFGLVAVGMIFTTPEPWLKAAGGLLLVATSLLIAIDLLLLSR